MKTNEHLLKPCSQCSGTAFEIHETINADGRNCYPYFCVLCGNRSPIVESKLNAEWILRDAKQ